VVAGTLFIIPGFFVILALLASYAVFQQTNILTSLFYSIKAAVLAIVIEAVIRVSRRALRNRVMVALTAIAFIALFFFAVPFPLVVLTAGIVGYVGARQRPDLFAAGGHGGKSKGEIGPAVINDNVPDVDPSWRRAMRVAVVWGCLWLLPWIVMGLAFGWGSSFASVYVFFSQMAVVTFEGPTPYSPMWRRRRSSPLAGCSPGR
jgi:chromate transporter